MACMEALLEPLLPLLAPSCAARLLASPAEATSTLKVRAESLREASGATELREALEAAKSRLLLLWPGSGGS
jgi:hypothetical protein